MYIAKAETQVNLAGWQKFYISFSKFGCIFPQSSEAELKLGNAKMCQKLKGPFQPKAFYNSKWNCFCMWIGKKICTPLRISTVNRDTSAPL